MLRYFNVPAVCSFSPASAQNPSFPPLAPPPQPLPLRILKFRTTHRENLRYLKSLGVINPRTLRTHRNPSPETLTQLLATVDFLRSKGFSEPHFARLAFLCPQLFSSDFKPADIQPVFDFLTADLAASTEESCELIFRCPRILESSVEFCLRPTFVYLTELGLRKLNKPIALNAHLLNTRVQKLEEKVEFLQSIGFSHEEAARACARLPAIFGYSIEHNLLPKYEYLVRDMKRDVEELKSFPQYFAFSLKMRIVRRHLHLKERNVQIPLNRMLLWNDEKFYAKWK